MTAPTSRGDLIALIDERMNEIARDASRSSVTQPRGGPASTRVEGQTAPDK